MWLEICEMPIKVKIREVYMPITVRENMESMINYIFCFLRILN